MDGRTSRTEKRVVTISQNGKIVATGMGDCVVCSADYIGEEDDSWLNSIEVGEVFIPQLQPYVGLNIQTEVFLKVLGGKL